MSELFNGFILPVLLGLLAFCAIGAVLAGLLKFVMWLTGLDEVADAIRHIRYSQSDTSVALWAIFREMKDERIRQLKNSRPGASTPMGYRLDDGDDECD